jgi:murein DD-endopeptidase MepM/ murein hydrolase activator NlpD
MLIRKNSSLKLLLTLKHCDSSMILNVLRSRLFLIVMIFMSFYQLHAQKSYPKDYFRSPLDIRLLLAGTFGEIRANHFHSGIDIKTNGAEGAPVYAVADGYVSRIKVSAYGFGKAFYVTHPNGYVSVYGHLSRYNKAIGDYVRKAQYARENFEIELFPAAGELPVKKGEIIAYSGNSGSSGGPHLHFEIRDGSSVMMSKICSVRKLLF